MLSLWREALQASPPPSSITFLFKYPINGSKRGKSRHKSMASYCWCSFLKFLHHFVVSWFQVFALSVSDGCWTWTSGQNFSPPCLWRNWLMSSSKFCRRNQEFAEPLCSHRNTDSKAAQPEMAGFGCSPTKKALPSYQPPLQEQKKEGLVEGLASHSGSLGLTQHQDKLDEGTKITLFCSA